MLTRLIDYGVPAAVVVFAIVMAGGDDNKAEDMPEENPLKKLFKGSSKKAGVGAYVHKSGGGVYVGEWKADKKHGEGRMAFKDGAVYDGSWRHHKRHGRGVYRYVNGDSYVGQWFTGAKRAPPPPAARHHATARHRATAPSPHARALCRRRRRQVL